MKTISNTHILLKNVIVSQCITEAERYAAKGTFVAKPEKNKAAQKQELWTECIQDLAVRPQFDGKTKSMLNRIAAQTNVPRKKPKFVNFVKNCMKYSANDAERIWQVIEVGLKEFAEKSAPQPVINDKPVVDEPKTTSAKAPAAEAEPAVEQSDKSEENGIASSVITLTSIIKHAIKQANTTKPVKKSLKLLQKKTGVPLNIDAPKKKKFTKYLQQQLELDEENAQSVCSALLESLKILNSSNGDACENGTTAANGVSAKKRKNDDESKQENVSKKAKTTDVISESNGDTGKTIDWQQCILKMFNKNQQNNKLALDTLKTKVIKKLAKGQDDSSAHDKNFRKQLKKVNSLQIVGNVVQVKSA